MSRGEVLARSALMAAEVRRGSSVGARLQKGVSCGKKKGTSKSMVRHLWEHDARMSMRGTISIGALEAARMVMERGK